LDFFDKISSRWNSGDLLNKKDRLFIIDNLDVNNDNLEEIECEIAMFKDLKK
jgi:hypothetical protein